MRLFRRSAAVPAEVVARAGLRPGDRVLAGARSEDGEWVLGTRRVLVLLIGDQRVTMPWEEVEDAAWDQETERLRVTGVGSFGEARPTYTLAVVEPALLLQLVRERVTASVVLQRRFPVRGRLGLSVIGRRSPTGGPVRWMHSYDVGLDPEDPEVAAVADEALEVARAEVGDSV